MLNVMGVIVLTVFLSLILVAIFLVLFLGDRQKGQAGGAEHAALLPLEEERSVYADRSQAKSTTAESSDS